MTTESSLNQKSRRCHQMETTGTKQKLALLSYACSAGGGPSPGWGQALAAVTDPSKQRTPSLVMPTQLRAFIVHWHAAKLALLRPSFTLRAQWPAIQLRYSNGDDARCWRRVRFLRLQQIKVTADAPQSSFRWRGALHETGESLCFLADHVTLCWWYGVRQTFRQFQYHLVYLSHPQLHYRRFTHTSLRVRARNAKQMELTGNRRPGNHGSFEWRSYLILQVARLREDSLQTDGCAICGSNCCDI